MDVFRVLSHWFSFLSEGSGPAHDGSDSRAQFRLVDRERVNDSSKNTASPEQLAANIFLMGLGKL